MKIRKIIKHNKKLKQLQTLKLYYKNKSFNFKASTKQIELNLNKIINIIYNFSIHKKKILFLGFPQNFEEILKNTQHLSIPKNTWFNGILSNRSFNTSSKNNEIDKHVRTSNYKHQLSLKLQKKLDLIVVCNLDKKNTGIEESHLTKIPIISFKEDIKNLNNQLIYKPEDTYKLVNNKISDNNFFFSIVQATLKRALQTKKVAYYKTNKDLQQFYQKQTNRIAKLNTNTHNNKFKKKIKYGYNKKKK